MLVIIGWVKVFFYLVFAVVLRRIIDDSVSCWVWLDLDGFAFGSGLMPLHPCARHIASAAAQPLVQLYAQLAMLDELRVGGARGSKLVAEQLAWAIEHPGETVARVRP